MTRRAFESRCPLGIDVRRTIVWGALVTCLAGLPTGFVVAQDEVWLSSGEGRIVVRGEVQDYTGLEITIKAPDGTVARYPSDRVLRIDTERSAAQLEADRMLAGQHYETAAQKYRTAMDEETRIWVRREIVAGLVTCFREMGNLERAGEFFLLLVRSDPETPHFDCIPLAWTTTQPSADVERRARVWIEEDDLPAAVLLGASQLISTPLEPQAVIQLRSLTRSSQPQVAALAEAQLWRTRFGRADPAEIDGWKATAESLPEKLRAGPSYAIGRALASAQRNDEAAVALLRVPILHPRQHDLAAYALFEAGTRLDKAVHRAEADRVLGELVRDYKDHQAAGHAIRYLESARDASDEPSGER